MERKEKNFAAGQDPDDTRATESPLFDDEATQVAQPVVPLTVGATSTSTAIASSPSADDFAGAFSAQTSTPYAGSAPSRVVVAPIAGERRTSLIALVIASVLVGCVLGGVGLWLYQKRQATKAEETTAATSEQTQEPFAETEAAQPPPSVEARGAEQSAALPPATVAEAGAGAEAEDTLGTRGKVTSVRGDADDSGVVDRRVRKSPADKGAERDSDDEERTDRSGKRVRESRDDGDDDRQRREERPRLVDTYGGSPSSVREARRAERAERRRARREQREERRGVDSVRSIFEGQPR